MKAHSLSRSRGVKLVAAFLGVVGMGAGCLNRPIEPVDPVITSTVVGQLTQSGVDKIDLLFVVDNSSSMADKQAILALAVPDLIGGLVNPPCINPTSGAAVATALQPSGPLGKCPAGSKREFPAVLDIHVGMITSSLGTFGADGCPDTGYDQACLSDTSNNDHGHLVTRTNPCSNSVVPTYQTEGFLAWDPGQKLKPPGEENLGDPTASPPVPGLATSLHDLVLGAGQSGCGFESQNEAWYRFLVDPTPYGVKPNGGITLNAAGSVVTSGTDTDLLQQRKEFLRPDSLLAIVVLTDETDTSIKEYGQYPLMAQLLDTNVTPPETFYLPLPRQDCRTKGPADRCCASCGEPTPSGCDPDPTCKTANGDVAMYDATTENTNIRAFGLSGGQMSQKTRFGIEFFYPPSRYIAALTSSTVTDATGKLVPNPIFAPAATTTGMVTRGQNLVFYAAITGVPWQLIARQDANGTPDLVSGIYVDPLTKKSSPVGGFKSYAELGEKDKLGNTFWDDIVGDPENYVPPFSPLMQESTVPRTGTDPITGIPMAPPGSATGTNPINGHEWWTAGAPQTLPPPPALLPPSGDIEYACIFPVVGQPAACPFTDAYDNPLCDPDPNGTGMLQTRAKAYPGVKNLAIAKGMKDQGIAASICAKQLTSPNNADGTPAQDYGYRPAVNAIIGRLKQAIAAECLPRTLTPDPDTGKVPCLILEARDPMGAACDCDGTARTSVSKVQQPAKAQAEEELKELGLSQDSCICVITQSAGADLTACESQPGALPTDPNGQTVNGWCYVDNSEDPSAAKAEIVQGCPSTEQRQIRFVGAGQPAEDALTFITCEGQ